jgi:hypothetical protein
MITILRNERRWLRVLRGIASVLCILAIVAFAYNKIVAEPLSQLSTTTVRHLRTRLLPDLLFFTQVDMNVAVVGSIYRLHLADLLTHPRRLIPQTPYIIS